MREGVPTFEMRGAGFDGSNPSVLLASPAKQVEYWTPSGDPSGKRLTYATVEPTRSGDNFRIYSLDLSDPGAHPVRIGDSDSATEPLTNGAKVVWKVVDDNVANWGKGLIVGDSSGGAARVLAS